MMVNPWTNRARLARSNLAPTMSTTERKTKVAASANNPGRAAYLFDTEASALPGLVHTEVVTAQPRRSAPNNNPSEHANVNRPMHTASQSSLKTDRTGPVADGSAE